MIRAGAIDATALRGRLDRFAAETGRKVFEEILLTARVIARSLATSTQPYGLGRAALMAGRGAVRRDISQVFTTPSGFYERLEKDDPDAAASFWKAWKARDLSTVREIANRSRAGAGLEVLERPSYELHQARRGSRGRVHGKRPTAMVLDPTALADYRRKIEARVGMTKAGWAGAAADAGAGGGFPAWASSAHAPMRGSATRREDPLRPQVTLHNEVEWARESLPESQEQTAVAIAEERLLQRLDIILTKQSGDPF